MLAVSGTLDERMFGPGSLSSAMKRRSIYFTVKRSQLIPSMVLFDGPDALQGVEQRSSTTVAPQALLLMNNTAVRECAGAFARRVVGDAKTVTESIRLAYRVAFGREPNSGELGEAVQFVEEQHAAYRNDKKPDAPLLAMTDFCQVLLEANEFLYID
jgi:hypothetical protein